MAPNIGTKLLQLATHWGVGGLVGAAIVGEAMFHIVATPKSATSANDLRILHRLVIFPPVWLLFQKGLAPLDRLTLCRKAG